MVAHSVDEVVEVVEMDEKFEVVGNSSARVEKGVANEVRRLPFPLPPPPPVSQHAYSQVSSNNDLIVSGMTIIFLIGSFAPHFNSFSF